MHDAGWRLTYETFGKTYIDTELLKRLSIKYSQTLLMGKYYNSPFENCCCYKHEIILSGFIFQL